MTELQELPIPNPSFTSIRQLNQLYVDKTSLIYELARFNSRQYFLARPRRFGKSLLISTLESLFRDGLKMFHGLAIEKLWKDRGTYKVLRLDFSGIPCETKENFEKAAVMKFFGSATDAGLLEAVSTPESFPSIAFLMEAICRKSKDNSVVLLVDEYDSPLCANLNNPEVFARIQNSIHDFYAVVKEYAGKFRFVFITGVTRFRHVAIFSAGSSIKDITLNPKFGTLLGYTEDDLSDSKPLGRYILRAAADINHIPEEKVSKNQIDSLKNEIRRYYDGYCFDNECGTHVYQTWSVLNFLSLYDKHKFLDYWYDSGGVSALLVNYFESHGGLFSQTEDMTFSATDFSSASSLADMDPGVLLTQCGYYTIKKVIDGEITVGIPNMELQHAQAMLLRERLFDYKKINSASESKTILSKKEITPEECADFFNKIFNAVSSENKVTDEYQACDYIKVYCLGSGFSIHREYHQKNGRADITVEFPDHRLVVEMKFARSESSYEKLLKSAEQQILDRDYGNYIPAKALVRFAMVFSAREQKIIRCSEVK